MSRKRKLSPADLIELGRSIERLSWPRATPKKMLEGAMYLQRAFDAEPVDWGRIKAAVFDMDGQSDLFEPHDMLDLANIYRILGLAMPPDLAEAVDAWPDLNRWDAFEKKVRDRGGRRGKQTVAA